MQLDESLLALMILASLVAMVAKRLRLPYAVGLVLAGLALGALRGIFPSLGAHALHLTPDLLLRVFLPALLFEAAFHLDVRELRANARAILLLALPGVAASLALTGLLAHELLAWSGVPIGLGAACLLGAVLAATDPVSVVALFRDLGAPRRLVIILEGESLWNDGVAVVAYATVLAALGLAGGGAGADGADAGWLALFFARQVLLGVVVGAAVGVASSWLMAFTEDHLVEITLTTVAAFGSYMLADALGASGVLAVVAAGVACGSYGARRGMPASCNEAVQSFWSYVAFAGNSIVFLLLGEEIDLPRLAGRALPILLVWLVLTIARALVVLAVTSVLRPGRERLPARWPTLLVWGGVRGGLAMVLALALPPSFAQRDLLVDLTFGVVLVTILVQGLTIGPLLRYLDKRPGAPGPAVPADAVERDTSQAAPR